MTFVVVAIGALCILFLILVAVGIRSRMIFANPGGLSDRQIESTIRITRQIMDRARPGSSAWTRAAAKHKAAIDEKLRRSGQAPLDDVELVKPG